MIKRIIAVPEAGIILTAIALCGIFGFLNPSFMSAPNFASMLRAMAYPGIVAVGLALCLISGTIDISVGATAGLAGVIFAQMISLFGLSLWIAIVAAIFIGALIGFINAFWIIKMRIAPFIATIAMMYVVRGVASFITKGYTIYPISDLAAEIGNARPLGVSWAFIIMIILMIVVEIMLNSSVWGLCVRATGSDIESAKCNEVDVDLIQRSTLVIAGACASLAGVLVAMMLNAGAPISGTGWELNAIAACAIGGVSLFGYQGSMVGLFFGLLVMQMILNGIVMIGVSSYLQIVVVGIILLVSIIIEVRRRTYFNLERI
jgi:ribose/xylose/arabinose/galactoside ABC-type transport system permease subunit